jgi:hypothetical protein
VAGFVAAGIHIDAAVAEDCNAAGASQIEIAAASVYRQAVAAMKRSHLSDCSESTRMDHPWVRLSLELKLLGRRTDCTEPDMGLASHWHSSEDCIAASGPAVIEATEHSAGGCTSEAAGIGQHTTMRRMSLVARQDCCSGILLVIAAPGRLWAAGYMYADRDTAAAAAAVAAEAVAAVAAELRILHFAPAGIDCIDRGNDWMQAAGIGRLGSKTFLWIEGGCGRARPSRGGAT